MLYYLYFTNEELVAQEVKSDFPGPYKGEVGSGNLACLTLNVATPPLCGRCAPRCVGTCKSSPEHELVN